MIKDYIWVLFLHLCIATAMATGLFSIIAAFYCKHCQLNLNEMDVYTRHELLLLTLGPSNHVYKLI